MMHSQRFSRSPLWRRFAFWRRIGSPVLQKRPPGRPARETFWDSWAIFKQPSTSVNCQPSPVQPRVALGDVCAAEMSAQPLVPRRSADPPKSLANCSPAQRNAASSVGMSDV